MLVLDEADRMLDMGFIKPIREILAELPKQRQTLLFSATMPAAIRSLADGVLRDPARVSVTPVASTAPLSVHPAHRRDGRLEPGATGHSGRAPERGFVEHEAPVSRKRASRRTLVRPQVAAASESPDDSERGERLIRRPRFAY